MTWINVFMTIFLVVLFAWIWLTRSKSPSDEPGDPPVAGTTDDDVQ